MTVACEPALAILHIPHASRRVPPEARRALALDDAELEAELLRMTDAYTDELFDVPSPRICQVVFPVSRLVVDPERFRDDAHEPMGARGMGAVYMRTSHGSQLRRDLRPGERDRLLAQWYDPHHQQLTQVVGEALDARGQCLIIDCHSFPTNPLPCDLDQGRPRPHICIGTDAVHTPSALAAAAVAVVRARGLTVCVNRPYAGALVPAAYWERDRRVRSIMIELNRSLYMDEATGARGDGFASVAAMAQDLVRELCRVSETIG